MKLDLLLLSLAIALSVVLSMSSFAGSPSEDIDADGIPNLFDNCVLVPNGPQLGGCSDNEDGDEDGYGNACDCDFNNDGACGLDDLTSILQNIAIIDAERDLNCDAAVGLDDLTAVLNSISTVPGPSGLSCSAANVKFTCPPI